MGADKTSDSERPHERILEEHHDLVELLGAVTECAERVAAGESRRCRELREGLATLAVDLRSHFRLEESSDLSVSFPVTFPRLAAQYADLLGEHARLLADAEDALERATALREGDAGGATRVCERVRELAASLRRHESAENQLIQGAFCDDLGGGD